MGRITVRGDGELRTGTEAVRRAAHLMSLRKSWMRYRSYLKYRVKRATEEFRRRELMAELKWVEVGIEELPVFADELVQEGTGLPLGPFRLLEI